MDLRILAIALVTTLSLTACGSNVVKTMEPGEKTVSTVENVPSWFLKTDYKDNGHVYAVGTAESQDITLSLDKALLNAQTEVAGKVNSVIDALTKQYKHDVGDKVYENTEQIKRSLVADVDVSKYEIINKKVVAVGGNYRSYVQIRYPTSELIKATEARMNVGKVESFTKELNDSVSADRERRAAAVNDY